MSSPDFLGFADDAPITEEWLLQQGCKHVPSSIGPEYADHLEVGELNVWEYNGTGTWLFDPYDSLELRTRGQFRMLAHLLDVRLGAK